VLAGADFNPPLFYLIQWDNRALFGEGLIALRLPEIVGFWIFSLCLFRFVSKRAGLLAGWVAMLIPSLSIAYYYAYEVRPHGLVLGFPGLR
jgi:4-amino-4-deoxy-L-arabinose transferase-like glycosyltransferase